MKGFVRLAACVLPVRQNWGQNSKSKNSSFTSLCQSRWLLVCPWLSVQVSDRLDRYCCGFTPDPTELCVENLLHTKCGNTKDLLLVHILVRNHTVKSLCYFNLADSEVFLSLCLCQNDECPEGLRGVFSLFAAMVQRLMNYSESEDKFTDLCCDWCATKKTKKRKENTFSPAKPKSCLISKL